MLCFLLFKPETDYLHFTKSAAGACHKMSPISVFEHTGSSAEMCGSSLCCCSGDMVSTDSFQAPLLCGLFFTASQLAAAGDAEAASKPLLKENWQLDKHILGCIWVKGQ